MDSFAVGHCHWHFDLNVEEVTIRKSNITFERIYRRNNLRAMLLSWDFKILEV